MRIHTKALLSFAAAAALMLTAFAGAAAQKYQNRGTPGMSAPTRPPPSRGGGDIVAAADHRGRGWGAVVPGIIAVAPSRIRAAEADALSTMAPSSKTTVRSAAPTTAAPTQARHGEPQQCAGGQ